MKLLIFASLTTLIFQHAVAQKHDTMQVHQLDEIVIDAIKITNRQHLPTSATTALSNAQIENLHVSTLKDISSIVPNLHITDYGSKLSTPVYVRGIGTRSSNQTVGLYLDHAPLQDNSALDLILTNVKNIEVHNGPQGTLYGRNAMAGIIHLHTFSPITHPAINASVTAGDYGLVTAKALVSQPLSDNTGLSVAAFFTQRDGFFNNQFTGKNNDQLMSTGARAKFEVVPNNSHWKIIANADFERTEQGAFPYGLYTDTKIALPNYDGNSDYNRWIAGGNLMLQYESHRLRFYSVSNLRYLDDDMNMDPDYTPLNLFTLSQQQKSHTLTEEIILQAPTGNKYQWLAGLYGFTNQLITNVTTTIGDDGIAQIIQPVFDQIHENNPRAPILTVTSDHLGIPGTFQTPTKGFAIFHQFTLHDLLVDKLDLTAGIRLNVDYAALDYNTETSMDMSVLIPPRPAMAMTLDTLMIGNTSKVNTNLLYKAALNYSVNDNIYTFLSYASGYKPGGYNIQQFADIVQQALSSPYMGTEPVDINQSTYYQREMSHNFEAGISTNLLDKALQMNLALYYIKVNDIQLTTFVTSGQGRLLDNYGSAQSQGLDLSVHARLTNKLFAHLNYGYAHATFLSDVINENNENIKGNQLPYAPKHTLAAGVNYIVPVKSKVVDQVKLNANYRAAGPIYWTNNQTVKQPLYGILDLNASAIRKNFTLTAYVKNLTNTGYAAFFFQAFNQNFAQKGTPRQLGLELSVKY